MAEESGQPTGPNLSEMTAKVAAGDDHSGLITSPPVPLGYQSQFPFQGRQFWIIGGDSRRYGPTDKAGLLGWFQDGRIAPDMMVVDDLGHRLIARRVFTFAVDLNPEPLVIDAPPTAPPVLEEYEFGFDAHFRMGQIKNPESVPGLPEFLASRSLAVGAFLMGMVFPPVGVILQPIAVALATRARQKGIAEAETPRRIALLGLGISFFLFLMMLASLGQIFGS